MSDKKFKANTNEHINDTLQKRESEVLASQLEQLKRTCTDSAALSSINNTLDYIRSRHGPQSPQNQLATQNSQNPFRALQNRMDMLERSFEDSILGDMRRHSTFRALFDDLRRDVGLFGCDGEFRHLFRESMRGLGSGDLLRKYDVDGEEPEDAGGVSKYVETQTVNGKSKARVKVEYTLKDGTKVQKVKDFVDGKPLEITES